MSTLSEIAIDAHAIQPRPSNRVVVVYASGYQAGQAIGFDQNQLTIGCGDGFDVKVDGQDTNVSLRVERQSAGWIAHLESGESFIINQEFCSTSSALRSGDLIRLSWRGPDVQFYLQSGAPSVHQLAKEHLGVAVHDANVQHNAIPTAEDAAETTVNDGGGLAQPADPPTTQESDVRRTVAVTSQPTDLRATAAISPEVLKAASHAAEQQKQNDSGRLSQKSLVLAIVSIAILVVLLLLYVLSRIVQPSEPDPTQNDQLPQRQIQQRTPPSTDAPSINDVSFQSNLPGQGTK